MQEHVSAEVLECTTDTVSKTLNKASAGVEHAATRLLNSTDAGNATVDRAAFIVGNSMAKGARQALEAIHNTKPGHWPVVQRTNASLSKKNGPVHTSQTNTSKEVNTSNSFDVLMSGPVVNDAGNRV